MAHKSNNIKGARKDLLLQRRWVVPTLPSEPTTSTWAWNDNGYTVYFRIGEQVRVVDGEQSSGYQFWKLYDIKPNGDRIWAPINSCAVSIHIFRVIENNYNTGQTAVGNAVINITSAQDDRNLSFTWNGQDVSHYLKKNVTYLCTPMAVNNFITPEPFSFTTSNADPEIVTHEITYNFRSERVEVKISRTNDTNIDSLSVSIISDNMTIATKSISTSSDTYTMLGAVLFDKSYHLLVAGSTDCWSGTLFASYITTDRVAKSAAYQISLPFTDERIDAIIRHKTSNGETFFDPEDVSQYGSYTMYIEYIASGNSTYEGDVIGNDIRHGGGNNIVPISTDPRNTAAIQYNISKWLLPGKYVVKCSAGFIVERGNTKVSVQNRFYNIQGSVTKSLTSNDNVIEFTWNLAYCYLSAKSYDERTPSIHVYNSGSGSSVNVTKTPENRTIEIGMVSVPGQYVAEFADIPYTYKGVQTYLRCSESSVSLTPERSSKRVTINGYEYSYWHHYTYNYTFTAEGNEVTIYVTITPDEFGESLPYGAILNVDSDRLDRHMGQFQIKYTQGSGTYSEYCDMYIRDFSSDNTCTLQKTITGRISTLPVNVTDVSMSIGVSYTIGGTQIDDNGEKYLRTLSTH